MQQPIFIPARGGTLSVSNLQSNDGRNWGVAITRRLVDGHVVEIRFTNGQAVSVIDAVADVLESR